MSTNIRKKYQRAFQIARDPKRGIRELVRAEMRDSTLTFIHDLFREEIKFLCVPALGHKNEEQCRRGGWEPGTVKLEEDWLATDLNSGTPSKDIFRGTLQRKLSFGLFGRFALPNQSAFSQTFGFWS